VTRQLNKTGLYSPVLSVLSTSSGISRGAARQSDTMSENQISGGEKETSVALDLVDCKPLEHLFLLRYLTKGGIDQDIARQYPSQIDHKASGSAQSHLP
jgi:hypothetical protein